MRIIQVINVRWFNATAWYALTLARLLQQAGHEVLVLTLPGTDTDAKAREWGLRTLDLDLNTVNPLRLAWLFARLWRLVRTFRPHVVNCHRGEAFVLWGLLRLVLRGRSGSFALVRTRGDQRPPRNNLFNRWLHRACADAIIATNSATAAQLRRLGLPGEHIWKIYGGVDTGAFRFDPAGRERVRAEFGFGPDDTVFGLLGRFDEVKGQRELIQSVAALRQNLRQTGAKLLLVGFATATTQEQVQRWIDDCGLTGHAVITGRRPDVAACISAMDVGVVASRWSEAIARAALEIMACGRPLISTRVGVMPDLLSPQALVPPDDVPALTLALAKAAGHPDFRAAILRRQQAALCQLTLDDFLAQTLSVYDRLTGGD